MFKCFIYCKFMQMKLFGQILYNGSSVNCIDFIQIQINEINHLTCTDHSRSQKMHEIACLQCKALWYFVPHWCFYDMFYGWYHMIDDDLWAVPCMGCHSCTIQIYSRRKVVEQLFCIPPPQVQIKQQFVLILWVCINRLNCEAALKYSAAEHGREER